MNVLNRNEMEKITKEDIRRSLNSEKMDSNDAKLDELVSADLMDFVTMEL